MCSGRRGGGPPSSSPHRPGHATSASDRRLGRPREDRYRCCQRTLQPDPGTRPYPQTLSQPRRDRALGAADEPWPRRSAKSSIPRTGTWSMGPSGIARTSRSTLARPTVPSELVREPGTGPCRPRDLDHGRRWGVRRLNDYVKLRGSAQRRPLWRSRGYGRRIPGSPMSIRTGYPPIAVSARSRRYRECTRRASVVTTRAYRPLTPRQSLDADGRANPPDVENTDTLQMRGRIHPAVCSAPARSSTTDVSAGQRRPLLHRMWARFHIKMAVNRTGAHGFHLLVRKPPHRRLNVHRARPTARSNNHRNRWPA